MYSGIIPIYYLVFVVRYYVNVSSKLLIYCFIYLFSTFTNSKKNVFWICCPLLSYLAVQLILKKKITVHEYSISHSYIDFRCFEFRIHIMDMLTEMDNPNTEGKT